MNRTQQAIGLFLTDATRMAAQAANAVSIFKQKSQKRIAVPPEDIQTFYQLIHTLKGTSTMVQGGESIVDALHKLEAVLTCQTFEESARNIRDWLPSATQALRQTRSVLKKMQGESPQPQADPKRGILAKLADGERTLWFPLNRVIKIFRPGELGTRPMASVQGQWVPVINPFKDSERAQRSYAIAIATQSGRAIIAVDEIVGVVPWEQASPLLETASRAA